MAVMSLYTSRGFHPSLTDWRNHSRFWEGRVEHVELGYELSGRCFGASRSIACTRWCRTVVSCDSGRASRGISAGAGQAEVDSGAHPVKFRYDVMLSEVSTWGIGGPARIYAEVSTPDELATVLRFSQIWDRLSEHIFLSVDLIFLWNVRIILDIFVRNGCA